MFYENQPEKWVVVGKYPLYPISHPLDDESQAIKLLRESIHQDAWVYYSFLQVKDLNKRLSHPLNKVRTWIILRLLRSR